jgi:hypothetical protein
MSRKTTACCQEFHVASNEGSDSHGVGAALEQDPDDWSWAVPGCCGGGCNVLTGLKFCPFCGQKLPEEVSLKEAKDES